MKKSRPSHLRSLASWPEHTQVNGVQSKMDLVYLLQPQMWYVEEEMEVTYVEPDSAVSRAQGQVYHLCGSPRPPDPVPPPGPAI